MPAKKIVLKKSGSTKTATAKSVVKKTAKKAAVVAAPKTVKPLAKKAVVAVTKVAKPAVAVKVVAASRTKVAKAASPAPKVKPVAVAKQAEPKPLQSKTSKSIAKEAPAKRKPVTMPDAKKIAVEKKEKAPAKKAVKKVAPKPVAEKKTKETALVTKAQSAAEKKAKLAAEKKAKEAAAKEAKAKAAAEKKAKAEAVKKAREAERAAKAMAAAEKKAKLAGEKKAKEAAAKAEAENKAKAKAAAEKKAKAEAAKKAKEAAQAAKAKAAAEKAKLAAEKKAKEAAAKEAKAKAAAEKKAKEAAKVVQRKTEAEKKIMAKKIEPEKKTAASEPVEKPKKTTAKKPAAKKITPKEKVATVEVKATATTPTVVAVKKKNLMDDLSSVTSVESKKFEIELDKTPEAENNGPARDLDWDGYGETYLYLLVRDPEWVFAYWEIDQEARQRYGADWKALAIQYYDVTDIVFDGTNAHRTFRVEVGNASTWYQHMPAGGRTWMAELGVLEQDGRFNAIYRSPVVKTPPLEMAREDLPVEWIYVDPADPQFVLHIPPGVSIAELLQSGRISEEILKRFPTPPGLSNKEEINAYYHDILEPSLSSWLLAQLPAGVAESLNLSGQGPITPLNLSSWLNESMSSSKR